MRLTRRELLGSLMALAAGIKMAPVMVSSVRDAQTGISMRFIRQWQPESALMFHRDAFAFAMAPLEPVALDLSKQFSVPMKWPR